MMTMKNVICNINRTSKNGVSFFVKAITLSAIFLVLLLASSGQAVAGQPCLVTNDDNGVSMISLRNILETVINGTTQKEGGCQSDKENLSEQSIDNLIYFKTKEYANNGTVNMIKLESPIPTKIISHYMLGNYTPKASIGDGKNFDNKDQGYVNIVAHIGFDESKGFIQCQEGSTGKIYLRNMVVYGEQTKSEFFALQTSLCLADAGETYCCHGSANKINNEYVHPENFGTVAWCNGETEENNGVVTPNPNDGKVEKFQDLDGDGFGDSDVGVMVDPIAKSVAGIALSTIGGDCDEANAAINPGADELCDDAIDNDCDGQTDEETDTYGGACRVLKYTDVDGDGYGDTEYNALPSQTKVAGIALVTVGGDCNDGNPTVDPKAPQINPGATEICDDNLDNDCDGLADNSDDQCGGGPIDADGDGFDTTVDCNDNDATINPSATEVCDTIDNNCNGRADEGRVCGSSGIDTDGDGFQSDVDCNDNNASINPLATEVCDNADNNCDGSTDEGGVCTPTTTDNDGDGFDSDVDCNDNDDKINPAQDEDCDDVDNNCDGAIDEGNVCGTPVPNATDADGDGFNNSDENDCNDNNPAINPGVTEVCSDAVDNNCDGAIDEGGCIVPSGQETECTDGLDNDGDAFVDCFDVDCQDTVIDEANDITCADKVTSDNSANGLVSGGSLYSCQMNTQAQDSSAVALVWMGALVGIWFGFRAWIQKISTAK